MPTDNNGVYSLPNGYLATVGDTIQPSQHNPPLEDIATALTGRMPRNGSAPMTGPLRLADGAVGSPSLTFASATTSGWFKTTSGIALALSGTQVMEIGPAGIISGITTDSIPDKAITLRKLYQPSGPSKLLGTNSNAALVITGAANNGSGLIRLTVGSTSTFATGQQKTVVDILGTTEANGTWTITVVDATHIDLQGSTFTNAYVSGGTIGGGVEEITVGAGLLMVGNTLTAPAVPAGYLFGSVLSNNVTDATNDIDVTAGRCRDALDTATILGGAFTKQLDSAWAAGTNQGGRSSAPLADGTWHVFRIAKPDNTQDVLFHTAVDPTAVLPSGYTVYRRIGSIIRVSSAIVQFVQYGDDFWLKSPPIDISTTTLTSTARTAFSLTVPSGIIVLARLMGALAGPGGTDGVYPSSAPFTDGTASNIDGRLISITNTSGQGTAFDMPTDTSRQIYLRGSSNSTIARLATRGWQDTRGRFA